MARFCVSSWLSGKHFVALESGAAGGGGCRLVAPGGSQRPGAHGPVVAVWWL
jgi:hypothetical protein